MWNCKVFYHNQCKKSPWLSGSVLLFRPRGSKFYSHLRNDFFSFMGSWVQSPLKFTPFFLCGIELSLSFMTFRYHKWYESGRLSSCQIRPYINATLTSVKSVYLFVHVQVREIASRARDDCHLLVLHNNHCSLSFAISCYNILEPTVHRQVVLCPPWWSTLVNPSAIYCSWKVRTST